MESIDSCRNYSKASKTKVPPGRQLIMEASKHPPPGFVSRGIGSLSPPPPVGSIVKSLWEDWSPQDDGIEVTLPRFEKSPVPRETVNEYIDGVLSGRASKRLPLFSKFCSDY